MARRNDLAGSAHALGRVPVAYRTLHVYGALLYCTGPRRVLAALKNRVNWRVALTSVRGPGRVDLPGRRSITD